MLRNFSRYLQIYSVNNLSGIIFSTAVPVPSCGVFQLFARAQIGWSQEYNEELHHKNHLEQVLDAVPAENSPQVRAQPGNRQFPPGGCYLFH